MHEYDVFFYEAFDEEQTQLQAAMPTTLLAGYTDQTIQAVGQSSPPARLISTRTQSTIPVAWAKDLAGVLSRSTGYDHLTAYRRASGVSVPCGHLPLYCARAVAEQAMLLWLALARRLPRQVESFATFHRDGLTGTECKDKVLLVVGVGNIGYEVAQLARAIGMHTFGVDLIHKHSGVTYTTIDQAIGQADVIVCAMNLTADNAGYFDYQRLIRSKRGAIFVNVARGEMSPPTDLLQLMREGHLGGVGLDVYDHETELAGALREGLAGDHPSLRATLELSKMDNVILTPHNAFNTADAVRRKCLQSVEQVTAFLETGRFLWPVEV